MPCSYATKQVRPRTSSAQCREVDALLRTRGDRTRAATVARAALALADQLGAGPVAGELHQLAQWGRLDLRAPQATAAQDAAEPLAGLNLTLFLTNSGLQTDLIFNQGFDLPEFAAFVLVDDARGTAALEAYYRRHADIAIQHGMA
jgi:hypothetical protein